MINDCPPWLINGSPLNTIEPGSSEKYLSLCIDPQTGISKPELPEKKDWLQWKVLFETISEGGHLEGIYYPTIDLPSRPC